MSTRVAINGYGRIGRCLLRALVENHHQKIHVVAINELGDNKTITHLTKYDSTHGPFPGDVALGDDELIINGQSIALLHEQEAQQLPWEQYDIDMVFECSGSFSDASLAHQHLDAGAKRVLFSQPATPDVDATIVYGINHKSLTARDRIVSNASCTTNSIVPIIHILDQELGIDSGVITTIHSAMNDQPVIDAYHHTDLRKTRSAMTSIIPVDTELARGIERILPSMKGRFEAQAMRVPTVNVSAIDLSVWLNKATSRDKLNNTLKRVIEEHYQNILGITNEPLASCDFNHNPLSGIVDASQTRVAGKHLAKLLIWFDNEWGYANRMLDVAHYWANLTD